MKTRHEILMEDAEYRKLYVLEGLVTDAAELVAQLMEAEALNKAQLARRLGKSRAWVTQLLSGKANMTIRTLAEVVYALGAEVNLSTRPQAKKDAAISLRDEWSAAFRVACASRLWAGGTADYFARADVAGPALLRHDQGEAINRFGYAA